MPKTEALIKEYIKKKTKETRDGICIPLSCMASEFNCSVATVWRTIQKLKEKHIIKIMKSYNKTEPDKIYYLGEENEVTEVIDELTQRISGTLLVLQELKKKINSSIK